MTAGNPYTFSITMRNSGTTTWSGSSFVLFSTNTPANLWFATQQSLGASETVAPGATRVFNLAVRAPATPGTYSSSWRMRQLGGS